MDKDVPNKAASGLHRVPDPSAAEESLSDALNGLEQILENRQGATPVVKNPDHGQANPTNDDSGHPIPLLHDAVVPGSGAPAGERTGQRPGAAPPAPDLEDDQACRKLAQRLANEIEVIVQARVEAAVHEAAGDIREQVRNHLEIMLPEIIEEFYALGRRQGD